MLGTEFVLHTIEAAGVGHLFMFVGGLVDPFLPAVVAGRLTPVVAANEAGAAYAADGYARASRQFGAVLVIGGPGVFNAVGAVGAADADGVPLLVLTGETATGQQGRGSFQDATAGGEDDLRPLDAMTRGSHLVPTPARARRRRRGPSGDRRRLAGAARHLPGSRRDAHASGRDPRGRPGQVVALRTDGSCACGFAP